MKQSILPLGVLLLASLTSAKRGYLLTAPKSAFSGGTAKVCLTLHEVDNDITVNFQINTDSSYKTTHVFSQGRGDCIVLNVPSTSKMSEPMPLRMWTNTGDYIFDVEEEIRIVKHKPMTFIQTDKPIYKPGQTVKFRMLTVDVHLKPVQNQMALVWIEDPSGARMSQWQRIEEEQGLSDFELPLSKDPVLGQWKIKAQTMKSDEVTQSFKVEEYVLPKFEVTINMPSAVVVNAKTVDGEICAKYTYGQPVKGSLLGKVCIRSSWEQTKRPCFLIREEINGCTRFSVNSSQIMLSNNDWSIWSANVQVDATVIEEATGIEITKSHKDTRVARQPVTIEFSEDSPRHYKPNMVYHGKGIVKRADNTPSVNEPISIEINGQLPNSHLTDSNGEFRFTVPSFTENFVKISVKAKATNYAEPERINGHHITIEPVATLFLKPWYSPSGSFLQIKPISNTVPCRETVSLDISYTTNENTNFRFYYQVLARNNLVSTGHKHHHFKRHDKEQPVDEEEIPGGPPPPARSTNNGGREGTVRNKRTSEPMPYIGMPGPHSDQEPVDIPSLPHMATFPIEIPMSPDMSPKAKIVVYYIREDGETVADSLEIDIEKCLNNEVEMEFTERQKYPGDETTLRLQADSGSLCSVGVTDKSMQLLGGNNQISLEQVFSYLTIPIPGQSYGSYQDDYCRDKMQKKESKRRYSHYGMTRYFSSFYDSSEAFKMAKLLFISNLQIDNRPCERIHDIPVPMPMMAPGGAFGMPGMAAREPPMASPGREDETMLESAVVDSPNNPNVEIRNFFPETWLWDLEKIGPSGEVLLTKEVPHTITEWVGNAFCTNTESGIGVSHSTSIKAFQPFFASFSLPYSVVRGEIVPIKVTVFNYLTECLVVELVLESSSDFKLAQGTPSSVQLCVCGSEAKTHSYQIEPLTLGHINITVKAASTGDDWVCGNELTMSSQIGARDAVTRKLLIEPEGIEEEYTYSSLMCPKDGRPHIEEAYLTLPDNLVPESARAYVSVIGDIMGPTLSGLDKLIRLPTGCGEQNMLNFAPNIYVMQYLKSTNQLKGDIEDKAVGFMKTGYQRELNYKHTDNSYSAFGNSDDSGSMWLTAFVVKSFAQARPYIFIDPKELGSSLEWFRIKQTRDGCFPQVGRVLHKDMKGGLHSGGSSKATLTAFVLAAMLEAGISKEDIAVQGALRCINSETFEDVYTLALVSYVYTLYNPLDSYRLRYLERLNSVAITEDGVKYWSNKPDTKITTDPSLYTCPYPQARSSSVEITAYAMLAHLLPKEDSVITECLPMVKWLTKQRNAYGGFSSTQDTIVALQALSVYAGMVYSGGIESQVLVEGTGMNRIFHVDEDNSLLLQTETVEVPNTLTLTAQGTGCVLAMANVKYNRYNTTDENEPSFSIRVMVQKKSNKCKKKTLSVCTRYNIQGEESNMAVVTVKMVSGWIPDKDSINMLMKDSELKMKRTEIDMNVVNFYFDEIDNDYKCFSFDVEQDIEVELTKPAMAKVFDYYDTDLHAITEYSVSPLCGTKEDLPFITREEYDKINNNTNGVISQARQPLEPFPGNKLELPEQRRICPRCLELDTLTAEDKSDLCQAKKIYKVAARNNDNFPYKVMSDIKPRTKAAVSVYSQIVVPDFCECDHLVNAEHMSKLYIILHQGKLSMNEGSTDKGNLLLGSEDIILTNSRGLEKKIRRAIKNCS